MKSPRHLAIVIGLGKPHPGPPPPFDGSANNRHKASSEQQGPKIKRDAFIYLDPQEPKEEFAQCSTCMMYTGATCTILGPKIKIPNGSRASCNFYVHGDPVPDQKGHEMALVAPEEAGLVYRKVRCENCASFDGQKTCLLYRDLNEKLPEKFELDENVDPYGCCNAQTPKDSEDGESEEQEASKIPAEEATESEEQPMPKPKRKYRAGVEI